MQSSFIIDPFDRHKMKWSRWVERLEGAFNLFGVQPDTRLFLLLHFMGGETYDILCDKLAPEKPQQRTYADIVAALEDHFNPEPLEILENFRFKCRRQGDDRPDESIDEYLIALRKLAITCKFGDYLNTALRNQFVFGLKDRAIQARLLEVRNLTLTRARDMAVSMELSSKGGREIQSKQDRPDVNLVDRQRSYKVQRVCLKAKKTVRSAKSSAHLLEEDSTADSNENEVVTLEELCKLDAVAEPLGSKFWLDVKVDGKEVRFEVDTGAPVSIINVDDHRRFFGGKKLRPPNMELVSFCNTNIGIEGMLDVAVEYGAERVSLPLYVTSMRKHPLLGRQWMRRLRIDLNDVAYSVVHAFAAAAVPVPGRVTTKLPKVPATIAAATTVPERVPVELPKVSTADVKALVQRYANLYDDSIGKIRDLSAKLRLQPDAVPVYIKARPVPFSLRGAVEQELEKLAYKQVDWEAYAIIFGVRRFYQYLYGRRFILVTDNEPLKQILSDTKGLPKMSALRMQHYAIFLQSFDYSIQFRPTKQHGNADAFSRLPLKEKVPDNVIEETDMLEVNMIETLPITVEELAKATAADHTVKALLEGLRTERSIEPGHRFGVDQSEFTVQKGCILRGIRVYVPSSLRNRVLSELHSTHFGMTRLKSLARGYAKLKSLKCDKAMLQAELCNVLITYRNTIHPATGQSPAMMVYNRPLRSRLDLMIPNPETARKDVTEKVRSIPKGARVAARDYIDSDKWKYGVIAEKLGKLHYHVQLDDGRTWKRHIDQLREVGSRLESTRVPLPCELPNIPAVVSPQAKDTGPNISAGNNVSNEPVAEPDFQPPSSLTDKTSAGVDNTNQPVAVVPGSTASVPPVQRDYRQSPRRSGRATRPPTRLDL
nr:uncharacterized protein LOC115256768 [Aedes albopictus]